MEEPSLYLGLLARVLTNTLFAAEPGAEPENAASPVELARRRHQFVLDFTRHYIDGPALSMLPLARLDHLRACIEDVIARNVPGDLIETGVWRGGATIFMRAALRAHGTTDRAVWVADSFEGLPKPDAEKFPLEAKRHAGVVLRDAYKHFAVSLEEVQRNFAAFGLLDEQVQFLKGWFRDTLPAAPIKHLAILRLDGDYYESTMDALAGLYPRVSIGGYVIVDDYGEESWTYCRRAVDEFRRDYGIDAPMIPVDSKCYYWQRSQ